MSIPVFLWPVSRTGEKEMNVGGWSAQRCGCGITEATGVFGADPDLVETRCGGHVGWVVPGKWRAKGQRGVLLNKG